MPPLPLQDEVEMQTPGAPPEPVHGPSWVERGEKALTRLVESRTVRRVEVVSCMVGDW